MAERETYLTRVRAKDMTDADYAHLIAAANGMYNGVTAADLAQDELQGNLQFWRIEGKAEGILVTQLSKFPAGRRLHVTAMAGKGVYPKQVKFIYDNLLELAAKVQCKYFSWMVPHQYGERERRAVARIHERLDTNLKTATAFQKEL